MSIVSVYLVSVGVFNFISAPIMFAFCLSEDFANQVCAIINCVPQTHSETNRSLGNKSLTLQALHGYSMLVPHAYDHGVPTEARKKYPCRLLRAKCRAGEHGSIWTFFTATFFIFFGLINILGARLATHG